jgi:hypothetical protein
MAREQAGDASSGFRRNRGRYSDAGNRGRHRKDGRRQRFDGPFLFSDYWASVLNLREIVNLSALSSVGISLELFRKILNRPSAALPRLGYFVIGSLFKPLGKLAKRVPVLANLRSRVPGGGYDRKVMKNLLLEHAMTIKPKPGGLADILADGRPVAADIVNPMRLRGKASMFFSQYKVFLASAVALGYGALVEPVSRLFHAEHVLLPYLGVLSYPIVLLILWFMFDDLLTASVAPLPLIAIRTIINVTQGFKGFVLTVVVTALVLYLVEWFFIPRSLPGALYLYVNDPESPDFPYEHGHEPYWLQGKAYWVWRYVTLAPAELLKFWEKDWERLEIWIRADGDRRGRIEWLVTDWHYRELWFSYETFTHESIRATHEATLNHYLATDEDLTWIIEMDQDLVFHTPVVRGISLTTGRRLSVARRLLAVLSVIFSSRAREDPEKYKRGLELLEIQGTEFLDDVPEHFRTTVTRRLLSLPWTYWRYPRGVKSARTMFLYSGGNQEEEGPDLAADRRFQIKEPG